MPFDDDELEKFKLAGKILSRVRESSKNWIKVGMPLVEIADRLEEGILELGGSLAFPANLSLNEFAAHYTPTMDDTTKFEKRDILKIDIGCHIDGYVADGAYTICFDTDKEDLAKATENAVSAALELATPGRLISEISESIENEIKALGFNPISNLSGHRLGRYIIHAEPSIPNVKIASSTRLEAGQVMAIEPFATSGKGQVIDTTNILILELADKKPTRNQEARRIISLAEKYAGLPFAQRWIERELKISKFKLHIALKELLDNEILHAYPALREISNAPVAQTEHTVIVTNPPIVTTK
jgi:methionyl aminopeptidase